MTSIVTYIILYDTRLVTEIDDMVIMKIESNMNG